VTREACRGALSSTLPHLTGSKLYVSVGNTIYMGEKSSASSVLVRKPDGNRETEKSRYKWEDNIEMAL
jgi:hypothetical protein